MTTVFLVILALAVLATARERRLGRDPAPALQLLAIATVVLIAGRCSH